jgi:hypothetical protein
LREVLAEAQEVNKALHIQAEQVLQVKVLQAVIILRLQIMAVAVAAGRELLAATELRRYLAQVVQVLPALFLVQP